MNIVDPTDMNLDDTYDYELKGCLNYVKEMNMMNIVDPTDMNLDDTYDYELKGCLNYVKEMSHL